MNSTIQANRWIQLVDEGQDEIAYNRADTGELLVTGPTYCPVTDAIIGSWTERAPAAQQYGERLVFWSTVQRTRAFVKLLDLLTVNVEPF